MSDQITRYQVNSDDSKTIKYQVQDNVNNDKLVRYQVQGIGGGQPAPDPVLESLTVTANGTYTPPEGVDGYNEVIADVPSATPVNGLIYDFDFQTENSEIIDSVMNTHISDQDRTYYSNDGIYGYNSYYHVNTNVLLMDGAYEYDIEIQLGDVFKDDPETLSHEINMLFYLNRAENIGLLWNNTQGCYQIRSRSYSNTTVTLTNLPLTDIHDLDNELIKIKFTKTSDLYRNVKYTIKGVDYNLSSNIPLWLWLGGYDNKALPNTYIKSLKVYRTLIEEV